MAEVTDVPFVQKNMEQSNTCNIIFENILANNHFHVAFVIVDSKGKNFVMLMLETFIRFNLQIEI